MPSPYEASALPNAWSAWKTIADHTASLTFEITAQPKGDTLLRCRVRYFKKTTGKQVVEEWQQELKITTANVIANVEVQFMGIPLGSQVEGTIS